MLLPSQWTMGPRYIYLEVEGFVKVRLNVLVEDIGVPAAPLEGTPARGLLQEVDHRVGVLAPPPAQLRLAQVHIEAACAVVNLDRKYYAKS